MEKGLETLSKIVVFNKYSKYLPELQRRETFEEIVARYLAMMNKKYPQLSSEIDNYGKFIYDKKVLPSMRAMQFAGVPIERAPSRIYNCCFLPIDSVHSFSEIMFLLLGGTGVGYSVQFNHINKLPEIRKPVKTKRYLIGDSIEGWADAVKVLMKAYLSNGAQPLFDFSDIRLKGTRLKTAGGKAPGPEPLKECLFQIEKILQRKTDGEKLTSVEVHDIVCHIADSVLAGGIRRAALIALFSADDEDMLSCKFGNWWEQNPQRGRANNSAVLLRHRCTKKFFLNLWKKVELSNAGEPGIIWTNNADWGVNPCAEIALRPYQFCNLCEVNVSDVESQEDLNQRVAVASFFGTLQAGFTDFHYLRAIWKKTTEKDALIGVGMTGIASMNVLKYNLEEASNIVVEINKKYAALLGINSAARTTTIKPSGTTSCVLGTSSGIHAWHNDYYIRRMQINKSEALYVYLSIYHPELVKDHLLIPNSAVIEIPIKAPDNSVLRDESPLKLLERVKRVSTEWVKSGHVIGDNTHNVSATISLKEEDWESVGEWMWKNREYYSGLSVLPFDGGSYSQAPFEDITKEQYEELIKLVKNIDLSQVVEIEDKTDLKGEVACGANGCEVK